MRISIYRSFLESIEEAQSDEQLQLYRAIALYALNQEKPQLKGLVKSVWLAIKPQLDANFKRYLNGKKGGAPRGNSNARKQPKNNQKQPNVNDNVNDGLLSADCVSLENVVLFFKEHSTSPENYLYDAKIFFWEFDSVGWIDREGNPIKNWRAVATQWIKNWTNLSPEKRQKIIDRNTRYEKKL